MLIKCQLGWFIKILKSCMEGGGYQVNFKMTQPKSSNPLLFLKIMMNVKLGKTSVKTMNFVSILTAFTSVYQNYPVLQITFKSLTRKYQKRFLFTLC